MFLIKCFRKQKVPLRIGRIFFSLSLFYFFLILLLWRRLLLLLWSHCYNQIDFMRFERVSCLSAWLLNDYFILSIKLRWFSFCQFNWAPWMKRILCHFIWVPPKVGNLTLNKRSVIENEGKHFLGRWMRWDKYWPLFSVGMTSISLCVKLKESIISWHWTMLKSHEWEEREGCLCTARFDIK